MTTKRRKLLALTLLAVIGGVIAYSLLRQEDEPTYQGRRLSEWLAQYHAAQIPDETTTEEVKAAVRNIATNGVPYLVKWIDYELPAWRTTLRNKVPAFVPNRNAVDRWLQGEAQRRAENALTGFLFLGTNASSAIPELERLVKNTKAQDSSTRAIVALAEIGEPALPVLTAAFADTNRSDRWVIIYSFQSIRGSQATNTWLPIGLGALNDFDPGVRSAATNVVKGFAPGALPIAPPK